MMESQYLQKMKKPELLLPAKDIETLKIAIKYGADAVYIGGASFGLRKNATNLSPEEMKEGILFAHEFGKKIYITANIIARNSDIKLVAEYFQSLRELNPDGVLVADLGMYRILKREWEDANIHISTQAGNLNYETVNFYYDLGIRRVVCERLLTLSEIEEIRSNIPKDMELEAFVHGAMCISYSGRCLLSSALTGRDANLGECTHPCRWKYSLMEENRPGEYFPIEEDDTGTYIMNSKDLCMIDKIPDLVKSGINSLKIEGRMKNILYTATMARSYRRAIDTYFDNPGEYEAIVPKLVQAVSETTHREYSHGFYYGDEKSHAIVREENSYIIEYRYLGYIQDIKGDYGRIIQKNKFVLNETVEIMKPDGRNVETRVLKILDNEGNELSSAPHPKQELFVKFDTDIEPMDIIRAKINE